MTDKEKTVKVLILYGSPRKNGNSATLADMIARGAESAGALVEKVFPVSYTHLTLPTN